jgi:hypothetical protein
VFHVWSVPNAVVALWSRLRGVKNEERTIVTALQAWLIVGIPAVVLAGALFYGRSRLRTALGYLVLFGAAALMLFVDRASAGFFGVLAALLYAWGRGGSAESEAMETSLIGVPDEVRRPVRHPESDVTDRARR